MENAFVEWKDGLPGTNILGSLDPIYLKRLTIKQANPNSIMQFVSNMRNVYITGASDMTVKRAKYYPKRNVIKALIYVPKLNYEVDYKVNGHFYGMSFDGQGDGQFEAGKYSKSLGQAVVKKKSFLENVAMLYEFTLKERITPEATFADVQDLKVTLLKTGNFKIHLNNLFDGDEKLENTANMLFNQNWRSAYEIVRPAIEKAIEIIMHERSKKAFNYIPAKYIFRNFHWLNGQEANPIKLYIIVISIFIGSFILNC